MAKKKSKYDLTIKTELSPDELLKLAATTPIKNKYLDKPVPLSNGEITLRKAKKIMGHLKAKDFWSIH